MNLSPTGKLVRLQALGMCISLALGTPSMMVYAADDVQFNTDVLDVNDRKNIDLSQFSRGGYIMPGTYGMVVHINKNDLPEQPIPFYAPEDDPNGSRACVNKALVEQLGLKKACSRTWPGGTRESVSMREACKGWRSEVIYQLPRCT